MCCHPPSAVDVSFPARLLAIVTFVPSFIWSSKVCPLQPFGRLLSPMEEVHVTPPGFVLLCVCDEDQAELLVFDYRI